MTSTSPAPWSTIGLTQGPIAHESPWASLGVTGCGRLGEVLPDPSCTPPLTSSLACLDQARLHTWEPVSMHCSGCPVSVFQKRMQRSAVPPPDASSPCWWGDQAMALTAARCSVYCCTGLRLEWFHTSSCRDGAVRPVSLGAHPRHPAPERAAGSEELAYLVVVASRGEELVVGGPLEPAHLLPVALQPPL